MTRGNRQRAAQQAGARFEARVRRKFRLEGFIVEKVDETTGFAHGVDLLLYDEDRRAYRVAVQCKATRRRADLGRGLNEARRGWPAADLFVCIHSLRQPGRRPQLRIALSRDCRPGNSWRAATWSELIQEILRDPPIYVPARE